jgi:hypothetical protein
VHFVIFFSFEIGNQAFGRIGSTLHKKLDFCGLVSKVPNFFFVYCPLTKRLAVFSNLTCVLLNVNFFYNNIF